MTTNTALHKPNTANPNANDVARFVYTWFTLFEHRARAENLTAYLLRRSGSVGTYFHPVGTCRLGAGPDAVIDLQLRVHGLDGIRVVDASVMPSLPAANTNATVLAIAERATAIITGHDAAADPASAVYTPVA